MRPLLVAMLLATLCGSVHASGEDIFKAHCVICHQANATGVPGMYPPLANSIGSYVAIPAGRAYLVHVISSGMTGAISVHGQIYDGIMQSWPNFKDDDLAQVLNYVLTTFNEQVLPKNFAPLTADEVKKYRSESAAMGDMHKKREALMKALASRRGGGS